MASAAEHAVDTPVAGHARPSRFAVTSIAPVQSAQVFHTEYFDVDLGLDCLGLVAGIIGSKVVNKRGEGLILASVLRIVGAVVGGFLLMRFDAAGGTGFNLYSMFVAMIASIVISTSCDIATQVNGALQVP